MRKRARKRAGQTRERERERRSAEAAAEADLRRIEAEFEVDQNRNGVRWTVLMGDNGVRVFTGSAVTVAPSGSFEVNRRIPNRAGTDTIVARATNPATGEVCRGTAVL